MLKFNLFRAVGCGRPFRETRQKDLSDQISHHIVTRHRNPFLEQGFGFQSRNSVRGRGVPVLGYHQVAGSAADVSYSQSEPSCLRLSCPLRHDSGPLILKKGPELSLVFPLSPNTDRPTARKRLHRTPNAPLVCCFGQFVEFPEIDRPHRRLGSDTAFFQQPPSHWSVVKMIDFKVRFESCSAFLLLYSDEFMKLDRLTRVSQEEKRHHQAVRIIRFNGHGGQLFHWGFRPR